MLRMRSLCGLALGILLFIEISNGPPTVASAHLNRSRTLLFLQMVERWETCSWAKPLLRKS